MPPYRDNLVAFIESVEGDICEDCRRRKSTNPIRVLDCKNEKCQTLYENAPKLINSLCASCESDFVKLAFEFVSDNIGSQSAIAGGGRYDRLVEFLDGRPTPAVGFAMGIERLLELIEIPESSREGYFLGAMDEEAVDLVLSLTQAKRKTDKASCDYRARNLKNHLKSADKINARYCCVIGSNELENGTIWVKDLANKSENILNIKEF